MLVLFVGQLSSVLPRFPWPFQERSLQYASPLLFFRPKLAEIRIDAQKILVFWDSDRWSKNMDCQNLNRFQRGFEQLFFFWFLFMYFVDLENTLSMKGHASNAMLPHVHASVNPLII